MEKKTIEILKLIATRVKGQGDTWVLIEDNKKTQHKSLTDTLEAWFEINQENVEFRLAPLDSKLYVILKEEKEIQPEPVKKYNLYGDLL